MHGQSSMLGMPSAAAVAGLGPWQASVHGPVVPSLHAGSASTVAITRLGMAGLARPPPAKRSLSPIAEHSDMSPVAVRPRLGVGRVCSSFAACQACGLCLVHV